ncbi:alpha/beta hydrolase [Actinoplanes sp. Pm04-4]|uniref:Alpha/beta hydrolase n=1 Tax=Paractinoplanes pyxinae TaxID=2997416 RepID=A0ABT4B950_9ACTN|nr:alpha/beta hydrolase [Actinoplanes pyxinae]MCY1143031.1 alpha/beta hydrolase [Actinoplanes pyxinae]
MNETIPGTLWEPDFLLNGTVPGTLWEPDGGDGPLILVAHGGGQHRGSPAVVGRARMLVAAGFRVAALDAPGSESPMQGPAEGLAERLNRINAEVAARAVPEWKAALDLLAPDGPAGFWGVSMGAVIGLEVLAAEPRITAGVLGLTGARPDLARRITVPIEFALQWDDELVSRESALALFDAFASAEKSLHANPGRHTELPRHEADSAVRFFQRHLRPA